MNTLKKIIVGSVLAMSALSTMDVMAQPGQGQFSANKADRIAKITERMSSQGFTQSDVQAKLDQIQARVSNNQDRMDRNAAMSDRMAKIAERMARRGMTPDEIQDKMAALKERIADRHDRMDHDHGNREERMNKLSERLAKKGLSDEEIQARMDAIKAKMAAQQG